MADLTRNELIKLIATTDHPLNLSGVDLSGLDLSRLDLAGAKLDRAYPTPHWWKRPLSTPISYLRISPGPTSRAQPCAIPTSSGLI